MVRRIIYAIAFFFLSVQSFAATWVITDSGLSFLPDSITITEGDTVDFVLNPSHNAQEVSQNTWDAFGSTPVIGFQTAFGGDVVTGLSVGTHYYVCDPHAGSGMRGKIVVVPAANPVVQFITVSSTIAENGGSFQIPVSITNPNATATSVDVNVTGGGTATSFVDFTFSPLQLTFPANSITNQLITVTITDDAAVEGNEFFTFRLNFPTNNAVVGTNAQHVVTITDNDNQTVSFASSSQLINENAGTAFIPVQLVSTTPTPTSVTVQFQTIGSTATSGTDFIFQDTTLTWGAGTDGIQIVPVTIVNDAVFEQNERVKLKLINATNNATLANDTFTLTIVNDDTLASGNCTDLFFSEYIEGSATNKVLEIYNPTNAVVDLSNYKIFKSINGGNSTGEFGLSGLLAAKDVYVITNSFADSLVRIQADTITNFGDFNGDDALALIHNTDTIDVIGEIGVDPGSSWSVGSGTTADHTLIRNYYTYKGDTSWTSAVSQWNVFPVDMLDSLGFHHTAPCGTLPPQPKASIRFTRTSDTELESAGTIAVVVQTDNPTSSPVSFFVARDNAASTAVAASDYNFTNQNIIVNDTGTTLDTVYIDVLDDLLIEPTETVLLRFINLPSNAMLTADSIYILNITDDDQLTVSFNGAGFGYTEKDTTVQVRIILSSPVPDTTRVSVTLAPGNAVNGTDFTYTDTTLVFLPNNNDTLAVWVTILEDVLPEGNEQINFNLVNPTNGAILGISAYTLTIIDNDAAVGISQLEFENIVLLFPNPVLDKMIIQTENELSDLTISDLLGNVVVNVGRLSTGRNTIDVSLLTSGMYFVNVYDGRKILTKRFVKQD